MTKRVVLVFVMANLPLFVEREDIVLYAEVIFVYIDNVVLENPLHRVQVIFYLHPK